MSVYETELEELGGRLFATVEIHYSVTGRTRPVQFANGGGYPGDPGSLEIHEVVVTSLSGSGWDKDRIELGDWADVADEMAFGKVLDLVGADTWLADHLFDNAE